jgi:hypothetical protein
LICFSGQEAARGVREGRDQRLSAGQGRGHEDRHEMRKVRKTKLHLQPATNQICRRAHDHLRHVQRMRKQVRTIIIRIKNILIFSY